MNDELLNFEAAKGAIDAIATTKLGELENLLGQLKILNEAKGDGSISIKVQDIRLRRGI